MKIVSSRLFLSVCALALSSAVSIVPALAHGGGQTPFSQLRAETKNFSHAKSAVVRLNQPMPNFAVKTLSGKGLTKASFQGKMGLFVLADTKCPCVEAVALRLLYLSKRYADDGLRVNYVFSMPKETPAQIANYMRSHKMPFTAILDRNQRMLKLLDGQCSSEVYLTDKNGILRYHGRVDDATFSPQTVKSRDLENAILALIQKKKVPRAFAPAMGCAIPRI